MKPYTLQFSKLFNTNTFEAYDSKWTEIIGEPYREEDFEKNLKKFVKKCSRLVQEANNGL